MREVLYFECVFVNFGTSRSEASRAHSGKSSGNGAVKERTWPVAGWVKANFHAWSM
jgi:hypothetical protein